MNAPALGTLVLATLLLPIGAAAQSIPRILYDDFKGGISDMVSVWVSPFRGDLNDYYAAGLITGGFAFVSVFDDPIGEWIYEHPKSGALEVLKPFRENHPLRFFDLGGGKNLSTINAGLYLAGLIAGSPTLREAGIGCAAAEKSNGIPRNFIYGGVGRERPLFQEINAAGTDTVFRRGEPYDVEFPGTKSWYDNSFFGGHGANIMSCASFFNHRFDLGLAEPLIWIVAAGVNVGRMADQRHWASDTAIGATVGFAIGKYVAERQLARARRREGANTETRRDAGEEERSHWAEGLYVTQRNGATIVGWGRRF